MDRDVNVHGQKDNSKSHDGLNASIAAQSGSHITAPVLTNNNIIGNVQIIHNAYSGITGHHPNTQNERTQTSVRRSVLLKYKEHIRNEYKYVTEYNSLPGEHVLLSDRYIQPLIIQKHRDQKEREEEISSRGETFQQVLSSRSAQESIGLNTLFNPDSRGITPGAVILQGNSGNGKSFTVQKMMMDWASDLYRTKFDIVFHLKCKEISHISSRTSLVELLMYNCCLTSDQISTILQQSPERVLFLVDGFDELKYTEDIYHMSPPTDPNQKAPPEVTLCGLLKGKILRESCLLVTTRSTAIDTLKNVLKEPHSFTEIIGFSEKGVEEYFKKFFQDDTLFRKGYEYVRANETLLTACSIPVICWIICTVIRERLSEGADVTSGLETTTSIYVDFLCTLLDHHCQGFGQSIPTLVKSLGKLAEKGILAQQVLFDEKTVYEMVSDPAGSPFLCKFLFKKRIHQETMFSFMHLSFQEFFTALYYLILDEYESEKKLKQIFSIHKNPDIVEYEAPRFAAVVHFIFGLLNANTRRTLLKRHGLLVHSNMRDHLKKWIFEEMSHSYSERTLFFFHCLYELHEADFVKEVTEAWPSVFIYNTVLRRTDCWVLVYCAQCCKCIKELLLAFCQLTSEKLAIIRPVLHKFRSVRIPQGEDLSDSDFGGMMQVYTRGQTLRSQSVEIHEWQYSVKTFYLTIDKELSSFHITRRSEDLPRFSLSFPRSELISVDWTNLFRMLLQTGRDTLLFLLSSVSVQKLELNLKSLTKAWADSVLSFTRDCPSLTEISLEADWFREEAVSVLQNSQPRPGCTLTFQGFRCKKSSNQCSDLGLPYRPADLSCNQRVKIHLNKQGFSVETLRKWSTQSSLLALSFKPFVLKLIFRLMTRSVLGRE